jgi:Protein of unknown function (DUF1573)
MNPKGGREMVEPLPDESRPSTVAPAAPRPARSRLAWPISATLAILLTCGGVALATVVRFGSIHKAIQYANGLRLSVDETTKSFGVAAPGQRLGVSFTLTNLGGEPIRVLGCQTDCSCVAVDADPFDLEAGRPRKFDISIEMPRHVGPVERPVIVFTNAPGQEQVKLVVVGRVDILAKVP